MGDYQYKPSAWQQAFHSLPHNEALGAGSAGPGKTECLIHEPLSQILVEHARMEGRPGDVATPGHWLYDAVRDNRLKPGASTGWALFLRRTFPTLEQTVMRCKRTFTQMDPGCEWVEGKKWFRFSSGFTYQFGHCKDIGDWENFLSQEYSIIMYDELVQFDKEQYVQINTRLRSSDPILRRMLKIRAMSNPLMKLAAGAKVRDPHWVRKHFVDPAPQGKTTLVKKLKRRDGTEEEHTRIYLPAKLQDNPDPAFVRDYELQLLNAPRHVREALIDGNWYVTAGSFYGGVWDTSIHTCKPFKIPPSWKRFRSMDWGLKSPGCVHWYAMDNDGVLWVEREYTFKGKQVDQVAKDIREIEEHLGLWRGKRSLITGPADTQLWEERGDTGKTKAQVMADLGVRWVRAKKNRLTNTQRLWKLLNDHNNGTTLPGIIFFQTCRNAIRTIPGAPTDPNNPELPLDGGEDHWMDSIWYGSAFASHGRAGIPSITRGHSAQEPKPDRGDYGYG